MAKAPGHRLGQAIGNILENILAKKIIMSSMNCCQESKFYLDHKHERPARKNTKKVTWKDHLGNTHDLDYVIEWNGSEKKRGMPRAFIEVAWRRYTRHSKAKAQEMQGAVNPVVQRFEALSPFKGAIIGGDWTPNSISQLQSEGFTCLYFTTNEILECFRSQTEIEIFFDEDTSDDDLEEIYENVTNLTDEALSKIANCLMENNSKDYQKFKNKLSSSLYRKVVKVELIRFTESGRMSFSSFQEALDSLNSDDLNDASGGSEIIWKLETTFDSGEKSKITLDTKEKLSKILEKLGKMH